MVEMFVGLLGSKHRARRSTVKRQFPGFKVAQFNLNKSRPGERGHHDKNCCLFILRCSDNEYNFKLSICSFACERERERASKVNAKNLPLQPEPVARMSSHNSTHGTGLVLYGAHNEQRQTFVLRVLKMHDMPENS